MALRRDWLSTLAAERRLADHTVNAYERDTRQFLLFLCNHIARPVRLGDIDSLRPADIRAYLAHRRREGAEARTLARDLAGIRSFLRWLEKRGLANAAGCARHARTETAKIPAETA